jgi:hypothetical protein
MPMMQLMAFSEISAKVERPPEAAGQLRSETVERQRGQVVLIRDDDFLMLQIQLTGNLQIIRPTRVGSGNSDRLFPEILTRSAG